MMDIDVKVFMVKNEIVDQCELILCDVIISSHHIINMFAAMWQTGEH